MHRATAGFVSSAFTELMLFVAMSGIAAAILVPGFFETRRRAATHECAVRIDSLEPDDVLTYCPVSETPYTLDVETGERCCPAPETHKVEAMCRMPDGPALADAHPAPTRARWIVTGILGGVSGAVFGVLAVGMIALSIWDTVSRARR